MMTIITTTSAPQDQHHGAFISEQSLMTAPRVSTEDLCRKMLLLP